MTAPVLADALGPRARRRVLIASIVTGAFSARYMVEPTRPHSLNVSGRIAVTCWGNSLPCAMRSKAR
mgnify:CR=1 FL=1